MSVYQRGKGKCYRWFPEGGEWRECAIDEPETRIRNHDANGNLIEGMIVAPLGVIKRTPVGTSFTIERLP